MAAVHPMAVEVGSTEEAVTTEAEDFTVAAVIAARAASEAEWDLAAAAGFVAARSAEERDSAEGQDFVVAIAFAAAFVATASAAAGAGADEVGEDEAGIGTIGGGASVLAGAGLMDIGPDTRIRTDMGTTRGGRQPTTAFLLMIPTTILTILTILTTTRHLHTQIGVTPIDIGTAKTRIRDGPALQ
jgi:hypothetical protein